MSRGDSSDFESMSNTRVYVGGLLANVRKEDLDREFNRFGRLRDVWVAHNPPGFAFIQFSDPRDAEAAVRNLDGQNVCGSRVRVEVSKTRSKQGDGGRGGGRGFGRGRGFSRGRGGGSRMSSRGPPRRPMSMSSRDRYDDYGGRSSYRDDSRNRDRDRFSRDSAMNGGGWGSRSPLGGASYRSRSPVGRRRLSPFRGRDGASKREQLYYNPPERDLPRDFPKRDFSSPANSFNTSYRSRSPPSRPRY